MNIISILAKQITWK